MRFGTEKSLGRRRFPSAAFFCHADSTVVFLLALFIPTIWGSKMLFVGTAV